MAAFIYAKTLTQINSYREKVSNDFKHRVKIRSRLYPPSEWETARRHRLHIRDHCRVKHLDKPFLTHLASMHPTSALHELCTRMEWPAPNMALAFECGPPMFRVYIFKARGDIYAVLYHVSQTEF